MLRKRKWKEFQPVVRAGRRHGMYAAITRNGDFVLNAKVYKALGEPISVVFLFDPATRCIGIRPSRPDANLAIPVLRRPGRSTITIRCRPFIHKYQLPLGVLTTFPTAEVDEEGILVLNLKQALQRLPEKKAKDRSVREV